MTITVRIPGEPHAQGRAKFRQWRSKDGRSGVVAYDPKESRNWKATAQAHMRAAVVKSGADPLFDMPLELRVVAVFSCPKTDYRKRDPRPRRWHIKRPDADNLVKAIQDAAKGVLWLDDAQVCRVIAEKYIGAQGEAPYVQIEVSPMAVPSCAEATASSPQVQTQDSSVFNAPLRLHEGAKASPGVMGGSDELNAGEVASVEEGNES